MIHAWRELNIDRHWRGRVIDTLTQNNWKEQINFSLYFSMRLRTSLAEGMGDHYIITQLLTHELALYIELNKWTLT